MSSWFLFLLSVKETGGGVFRVAERYGEAGPQLLTTSTEHGASLRTLEVTLPRNSFLSPFLTPCLPMMIMPMIFGLRSVGPPPAPGNARAVPVQEKDVRVRVRANPRPQPATRPVRQLRRAPINRQPAKP